MKLHLPKGIRTALLACVCGAVAIGQSAFAYSFTETGKVGDINISQDSTINVAAGVEATANKIDNAEATYTKTGAGTLIVTNAPTANRPSGAVIEDGTLVIQYVASWGGGFVSNDATVKAGATLKLDHENALGAISLGWWDTRGCANVILNGSDEADATLEVAKATTLFYTLQLNGNTVVSGDGGITASVGGSNYNPGSPTIQVTGKNNTISTAFTVSDATAITGTGTVDFAGALTLNNVLSIASGATVISSGTLTLGEDFNMTLGEGTLGDDNRYTFATGLTVTGTFNKGAAHGAWEVVNNQLVLVAANHTYSNNTLAWSEGGAINDTTFASGDLITFTGNTEATLGSDVFSSVVTVEKDASLNVITNGNSFATNKLVLAGSLKLDSYAAISGLHAIEAEETANITLNVGVGTDKEQYNKLDDFCNAYTGDLVLQNGRYSLHNDNGGAFSDVTVEDGAQFAVNRTDYTGDITITGVGVEEGHDDLGGALKLFNGRKISGKVTVDEAGASILVWGSDAGTLAGTLQLGGELAKTSGGTLNLTGTIAGSGALNIKGGTVNVNSESDNTLAALKGNGTLKKSNTSTLTITDAASFTGDLNVESGTVSLASGMTAGKITLGGTLELTSTSGKVSATTWEGDGSVKVNFTSGSEGKVADLLGGYTGAVEVANGSLNINSGDTTFASVTGNGGRVVIDGVTYNGGVTLTGNGTGGYTGDLVMGPNAKLAGALTVNAGSGIAIEVWGGNTGTIAGGLLLNADATVGKEWNGTVNVEGNVSGSAALAVQKGTLNISGTVADTVTLKAEGGNMILNEGTYSSAITGAGKVTTKGNLYLTNATGLTGKLELAEGSQVALAGGTYAAEVTGSGTIGAAGAVELQNAKIGAGVAYTVSSATRAESQIAFNGNGTTGLTVTSGTIAADGTTTDATINVAADATLGTGNNLTLGSGSTLVLAADATGNSALTLNGGTLTFNGGTLDLTALNINTSEVGSTTLFSGGTVSGLTMDNITGVQAAEGFTVDVDDNGNLVVSQDTTPPVVGEAVLTGNIVKTVGYDSETKLLTFKTDIAADALLGETLDLSFGSALSLLGTIPSEDYWSQNGVSITLQAADGSTLNLENVTTLSINGYDGFDPSNGGFAADADTSAVKDGNVFGNYYAPSIPEPATATLSLLALAALAARRRRRG